jgi:hypothetical protein
MIVRKPEAYDAQDESWLTGKPGQIQLTVRRCWKVGTMTIAACYLPGEGVVLGADSTTTMFVPGPKGQMGARQQYNFCQKIFELGEPGSTVGVVLWGLGSLGDKSYRTLIAEMADKARNRNLASLGEVADIAAAMFWDHYRKAFAECLDRARMLDAKGTQRTQEENQEWEVWHQSLSGGFCLGGRWGTGRQPGAFEVQFGPFDAATPQPQPLSMGNASFWGWSNLIDRLIIGADFSLFTRIVESGKWNGSPQELANLIFVGALGQPRDLPLREAIDWIYASIYTTIKAMKFSHLAPVCGGPIEIAVISSDRPFRWVRHKQLGAAISAHLAKDDWVYEARGDRR